MLISFLYGKHSRCLSRTAVSRKLQKGRYTIYNVYPGVLSSLQAAEQASVCIFGLHALSVFMLDVACIFHESVFLLA